MERSAVVALLGLYRDLYRLLEPGESALRRIAQAWIEELALERALIPQNIVFSVFSLFFRLKQCLRPKNNVSAVSNNVFSQKTMFDRKKQCLTASNIEKSRRSLEKAVGAWEKRRRLCERAGT